MKVKNLIPSWLLLTIVAAALAILQGCYGEVVNTEGMNSTCRSIVPPVVTYYDKESNKFITVILKDSPMETFIQ